MFRILLQIICLVLPVLLLMFISQKAVNTNYFSIIRWGLFSDAKGPFIALVVVSIMFVWVSGKSIYNFLLQNLTPMQTGVYIGTQYDNFVKQLMFNKRYVIENKGEPQLVQGEMGAEPDLSFKKLYQPLPLVKTADGRYASSASLSATSFLGLFVTPFLLLFVIIAFAISLQIYVADTHNTEFEFLSQGKGSNSIEVPFLYLLKTLYQIVAENILISAIVVGVLIVIVFLPSVSFKQENSAVLQLVTMPDTIRPGSKIRGTLLTLDAYNEEYWQSDMRRSPTESQKVLKKQLCAIIEFTEPFLYPVQLVVKTSEALNEELKQQLLVGRAVLGTINQELEFVPDFMTSMAE